MRIGGLIATWSQPPAIQLDGLVSLASTAQFLAHSTNCRQSIPLKRQWQNRAESNSTHISANVSNSVLRLSWYFNWLPESSLCGYLLPHEMFRRTCPWAADASVPPWVPQWLRLRWITIYLPEEEAVVDIVVFCTSKGLKYLAKDYKPDFRSSWAYYLPNPVECTSHNHTRGRNSLISLGISDCLL